MFLWNSILGFVDRLIGLYFRGLGCFDCFWWNPTTRKSNVLANPINSMVKTKWQSILSRLGPYNFGYDRFQDDYKIIAKFGNIYQRNLELKIYSLNNDSWKTIVACDVPYHYVLVSLSMENFISPMLLLRIIRIGVSFRSI